MCPSRGWGAVFSACLALGCASAHSAPPAPVLELRIDLGNKTEFFEGEPIYAVLTLRNASADTVPITHFGLVEDWLRWSLHRRDGPPISHRRDPYVDSLCPRPGLG